MSAFTRSGEPDRFHADVLLDRLRITGRFGLTDASLEGETFRASFPYEFRSQVLRARLEPFLLALLANPDASKADRLWAFSFMEDDPEAILMLKRSDPIYVRFLFDITEKELPIFIEKMARFQLVVLSENGFTAGIAYVEWVRMRERDTVADMKAHLASPTDSPIPFLIHRVHSRALLPALPITVYRLGIFGDSTTVPVLEALRDQYAEAGLHRLVDEAIQRIDGRTNAERASQPCSDDGAIP